MEFEKLIDNLYRLCVPFDNIYTSVFAVTVNENCIILDCGSDADDVERYVYPAIKKAVFFPDWIVISHSHSDHSGGLPALTSFFPNAKIGTFNEDIKQQYENAHIFTDGEILCNALKLLNLKGHSPDSLAVLDMRTNTVLTFDCVQLSGVGRYRSGITDKEEYLKALNHIEALNAENLIASHDYEPLGFSAFGKENVLNYIKEARKLV